MRGLILAVTLAAGVLAGCGGDQSSPAIPGAEQVGAATQSASSNGWLWGLGGFLMGRALSPSPAPAAAVVNNTTHTHTREIIREVAKPAPAAAQPPVVSTAPKITAPAPKVTSPAPSFGKPSFSSGYSYKSTPSVSYGRGFSGGRR